MADGTDEEIAHLEQLIATLRRRQRVLDAQRVRFDTNAIPPQIVIELEDLAQEIARNTAELRRLRPGPASDHNPYLGLLTFQEADADRFFGRDALVADLIDRASRAPFLAVLGASGSGKSSVVRAGLLPMLRGGALPGSEHWRYITLRPGPRPLDALAVELAKLQDADLGAALVLSQQLVSSDRALLVAAGMLLDRSAGQRLVLVIDQAEELWTLAPSDSTTQATFIAEQQRPFIQLLLTAIAAADAPLLIVLTMRADFLHRAAEHPALAKAIAEHDVIASPMDETELRDAILRPAKLTSGSFESGLVDELAGQTFGRAGALPLLEYTLQELWKRQDNGQLTWTAYRALGGIEGALAARADAILAERYTLERQDELRRLLLRLVQLGEGTADTRRRVPLSELVPAGASVDAVQALLKPLTDERLLTTGRDSTSNVETVEISHEALIRAWPTFGRWLDADRVDLRFQLQLEDAAREWQASDKNADLLWSGLRLAQAEAWITRAAPQLNARDMAFLDASRVQTEAARQRSRRQAQRLRWLAIGLAVALLVTLVALGSAGIFATRATQSAVDAARQRDLAQTAEARSQDQLRVAQSQSLAYAAESLRTTSPETALLLANEALLRNDNFVTTQTMRDALEAAPWRPTSLQDHTSYVSRAVFSPDGQRILTASLDGIVRLWNLTGKQVITLPGHTGFINSMVFSPDSQRILTVADDHTAWLWNLTSKQVVALQSHMGVIKSAVFSPDGQQILTASDDHTARLWDLTGKQMVTLQGHTGVINSAVFSPDGQHILTASDDHTARLWDLTGKQVVTLQGHTGVIKSAVFSPDGQHILTASDDHTARMWNLTGKQMLTLQGYTSAVFIVAFSPDGQHILLASYDGSVQMWDLIGKQVVTFQGHTGVINSAVFSPDGQHILTASYDGTARLWDLTGKPLATLQGHTGSVNSAVFSPDGQHILTASDDGTARLWDFTSMPLAMLQGHTVAVYSAMFSPDGQRILTAFYDGTARLWDLTGMPLATLLGHTDRVTSTVFSPDGQRILTTSYDGTARLWDLTGKPLATLQGHTDRVNSAVFSPDGQHILTASDDGTARLWDLTGKQMVTFHGHTDNVRSAVFSPDGQQILTASDDGTARLWDLIGKQVVTFHGHTSGVLSAVFSPDGQRILTASVDDTARVWDLTGKPLAALQGHTSGVLSAVFSLDGQRILTASEDGTARVWNLTGKPLTTLQGHTSSLNSAVFSPDEQHILTASYDGTARLWDLSGKQVATLRGHTDNVTSAVFSPDGQRILTASWDGTARQYLVRTEDLLAVAACRVGRGLTLDEIQRYQVPTPLLFDFSKRQCPPPIGN